MHVHETAMGETEVAHIAEIRRLASIIRINSAIRVGYVSNIKNEMRRYRCKRRAEVSRGRINPDNVDHDYPRIAVRLTLQART